MKQLILCTPNQENDTKVELVCVYMPRHKQVKKNVIIKILRNKLKKTKKYINEKREVTVLLLIMINRQRFKIKEYITAN